MHRLFNWLFVASLLGLSAMSFADGAPESLPIDVTAVDSDMRAFDNLYLRLQEIPPNDKNTLLWLYDRVHALPPLFRYELARRLNVVGIRDDALLELARARLARDVDAAECVKKDRNTPSYVWMTITNSLETGILNSPRYDKDLWFRAIAGALKSEPHRKRTSALWLCGQNNIKDSQTANDARRAAFEFKKRDFEKMKSEASASDR